MLPQNLPTLLVEDDPLVAESIAAAVQDAGGQVVGTVSSGEEALALAETERPPVVLMDIQLAGALDGIDTARELRRIYPCGLIFLSEVQEKETLKRMKALAPYFFLPKPVSAFQLAQLLPQIVSGLTPANAAASPPTHQQDSLYLKTREKEIRVRLADIRYLQADDKYCRVFARDTATFHSASHTLAQLHTQLQDRSGGGEFMRIHKSYVVHWAYVQARYGNQLELTDGTHLPVGRTYRKAVFARMQ